MVKFTFSALLEQPASTAINKIRQVCDKGFINNILYEDKDIACVYNFFLSTVVNFESDTAIITACRLNSFLPLAQVLCGCKREVHL